ncbi:kappa-carrageenase precursor [Clostridium ragsdalei P11]|uniref:Kappa-carrageenase n=1 Tax=Clostridium ragsdalei P11 TaxID=1353534 RepID=A0A1A6AL37_9CLOT|nr:CFI-box-CTERM domain-containing protein [Clostridium ragsdalei]OBR90766.1 kappa-carrageenase precursor [Clostridium ragsdalei P11]
MESNTSRKILCILFSVLILFASSIGLPEKNKNVKAASSTPQNVTIKNSSGAALTDVKPDDQVTVSGTYTADTWVSIKIVDDTKAIVFYDAVKSGSDGSFKDTLKIPENTGKLLTVVTGSGSEVVTSTLNVVKNTSQVKVTGLDLDKCSTKVEIGKTVTLVATVLPQNATDKKVIWSSSDTSVATVDQTGNVKGIKEGKATITATTEDGNISKKCEVKVIIDECFIATAAYGSKFQPSVVLLRHFRDDYLLTNSLGTGFVKFYYRHSPPIANFIAHNVVLKNTVKVLLAPFVGCVYGMYHPICAAAILGVITLTILAKRRQWAYSKL